MRDRTPLKKRTFYYHEEDRMIFVEDISESEGVTVVSYTFPNGNRLRSNFTAEPEDIFRRMAIEMDNRGIWELVSREYVDQTWLLNRLQNKMSSIKRGDILDAELRIKIQSHYQNLEKAA